jgi:hypothetical protein
MTPMPRDGEQAGRITNTIACIGGRTARCFGIATLFACIAAALAMYAPALGSRFFVSGTDTYSHDYIMHLYGWGEIAGEGRLPLWCPYLFCGFPFVASFALCPFYPSQWLYFLPPHSFAFLNHNAAFTLQYALAVALAGIFSAIWARETGRSRTAALWAALALMVSGHFLTLTHAGHLQKMIAIAWAPLALAASHRMASHRGGWRAATLLGVSLAMQLLASHTQIAYATAAACAAYLLFAAAHRFAPLRGSSPLAPGLQSGDDNTNTARAASPSIPILLAGFAFAAVVAIMLSAVQMFPGMEMSSVSNRAAGVAFEEAVETSYPPLELLEYVIPRVFGDSVRDTDTPYFGAWGERIVSDFLGAPIVLLVIFGIVAGRGRYRFYLAAMALVSIAVGLGKYTPLYRLLFDFVPGFQRFRSPGTFMFLTDLALVQLAAGGIDAIREHSAKLATPDPAVIRRARRLGWFAAATMAVSVVAVTASFVPRMDTSAASPEEAQRLRIILNGIRLLGCELTAAALLIFFSVSPLRKTGTGSLSGFLESVPVPGLPSMPVPSLPTSLHESTRIPGSPLRNRALAAAAVLALGMSFVHNRHFLRFEPLAPYLDYLHSQPVYAALEGAPERPLRLLQERALKNDGILHAVAIPTGYHPILLGRYGKLMQSVGFSSPRFADLFALGYAHTYSPKPPDGKWEILRQNGRDWIWRNTDSGGSYVQPSRRIVAARNADDAAAIMRTSPADDLVVERTFLETARLNKGAQQTSGELLSWSPRRVRIKAQSTGPAILALADPWAPGWKARTDKGATIPVIPANAAQRALVLPGGEQVISLTYEPFSQRLGAFLTLATLATAATTLRNRRRTGTP